MSRSGLIALIVIAVLTVAAGVYWYMEFMPLADFGSKKQTEASEEPPTEQVVAPPAREPEVEAPVAMSPPPPVTPLEREPIVVEEPVFDDLEVETTLVSLEESDAEPDESAQETAQELLPVAVEVPYTEVEVTIIPFADLEEILGSELFALAPPLDIDLTTLKAKPEEPVVSELPLPLEVEEEGIESDEPIESELLPPPPVEEEEIVPIEPIVAEAAPPAEVLVEERVESTPPVAAEALSIPRARVEHELEEQFWNAELRVSAITLALPSFKGDGFGFELGLLHRHGELFSWGGGLAFGKNATDWQLDLLASGRWTFEPQAKFSYPLTISLGPSVRFSSPVAFGLVARVTGGVTFTITDHISLFYEAGLSMRWYLEDTPSFGFEPARIGFSYSF